MSRFADPAAKLRLDLGACQCPGAPHESDWADLRGELSSVEVAKFAGMAGLADDGVAERLATFVLGWNLLGPNGEPWPPSADSLLALKLPTIQLFIEKLGEVVDASVTLPKGSSGRSPGSSPEKESPTQD